MAEGASAPAFYTGLGGRPWFDVARYGAKGDGTTDDTAALAAAIAAAQAVGGGGVVYLPKGCYLISSTLTIATTPVNLMGVGWGTSSPLIGSSIKWGGSAGSPMVKIQNAFGVCVQSIRFIGNTAARPSCALEIKQLPASPTQDLTLVRDVWIGEKYSLDSDQGSQFVSGIIVTGASNGNSNQYERIMITGCTAYGIDFQSSQAACNHLDTIWIQNTATGIRSAAQFVGTNVLITNSTASDLELVGGGVASITDFQSESSAAMCLFTGGASKLIIRGGRFQATASLAASGRFIDTGTQAGWIIDLQDFYLDTANYTPGPVPTIRAYNASGGITTGSVRLIGTWNLYPNNLDLGTLIWTNDSRVVVFQPAQNGAQDPMPSQQVMFDYATVADRTFQVWRNDFAGKFNLYGGPFKVGRLVAPLNLAVAAAGGTGTTYGYRVSALTYDGETVPCTEVTCSGGAALGGAVKNTLTWNHVQGAYAYKIYGRTSAAELLMATLTWNQIHPGYTLSPVPTYVDDGSASPSGAMPTKNTTANARVEGQLTLANSGGSATSYEQPLWLGSHALWVDSTGDLRIKSSAPTSDTDGTVVGTQT